MPRDSIKLPYLVECLSILDEDGNLDEEQEPDLRTDHWLNLQRAMLLGCQFDERGLDSPLAESALENAAIGIGVNV